MKKIFTVLGILLAATPALGANNFGIELAGIGDIDGDNYTDLISVGNAGNKPGVYAISGDSKAVIWKREDLAASYVNFEFSPVIQLNASLDGDALPDIAFGMGRLGQVWFLSAKDGKTIGTITGTTYFGTSLANASDIDNDGTADLYVGAPATYHASCSIERDKFGMLYAVSLKTLTVLWSVNGPAGSANFGWALDRAGSDYNRDGRTDLAVTDNCRVNDNTRGRLYIVDGQTGAVLQTWSNSSTQSQWQNIMFGYNVRTTFDLDNDGVRDFYVGAPNEIGQPALSTVQLISGANGALLCKIDSPAATTLDGFGSSIRTGFKWGSAFSYVGSDLLAGMPDFPNAQFIGRAYVLRPVMSGNTCTSTTVLHTFDLGGGTNAGFGNRVDVIPYRSEMTFLINRVDDPNAAGADQKGVVLRFNAFSGNLMSTYQQP